MDLEARVFQTQVLYSSVIFAQASQRLLKAIALSDLDMKPKTWPSLYEMAYTTSFVNLAKVIGDSTKKSYDLEALIKARYYTEKERKAVIISWTDLKNKHKKAFKLIRSIRNDIVAHNNGGIRSLQDVDGYVHESDITQQLTYDLISFIEQLPWFTKGTIVNAPQYTDYKDELGFNLAKSAS